VHIHCVPVVEHDEEHIDDNLLTFVLLLLLLISICVAVNVVVVRHIYCVHVMHIVGVIGMRWYIIIIIVLLLLFDYVQLRREYTRLWVVEIHVCGQVTMPSVGCTSLNTLTLPTFYTNEEGLCYMRRTMSNVNVCLLLCCLFHF
jgi:hypothetical protein